MSAATTERTFLWPSQDIIAQVVGKALRQAEQMAGQELRELPTHVSFPQRQTSQKQSFLAYGAQEAKGMIYGDTQIKKEAVSN